MKLYWENLPSKRGKKTDSGKLKESKFSTTFKQNQ